MSKSWVVAALLSVSAAACADQADSLDGSVSEFYPLGFKTVRARLYSSELAIEYVKADGETVVRVSVRRADLDPDGPMKVALTDVGDITGSADGAEIPPFTSGTLSLAAYRQKDGAHVSGSFEARLESGDVGLSIRGTFDTHLTLVEDL